MRTPGSKMKTKSKQQIENELELLRGITLGLYKALSSTPETPQSKQAMDDFIKYITEKL